VPDIAIEVIVSSGLVDKMAVYAGLCVPEVWEWRPSSRALVVHRWTGGAYERRERSEILPELDLALLSSFVQPGENPDPSREVLPGRAARALISAAATSSASTAAACGFPGLGDGSCRVAPRALPKPPATL